MKVKQTPNTKTTHQKVSPEFERFRELTQKLVSVPKYEVSGRETKGSKVEKNPRN